MEVLNIVLEMLLYGLFYVWFVVFCSGININIYLFVVIVVIFVFVRGCGYEIEVCV